jgi:hypothetical protein
MAATETKTLATKPMAMYFSTKLEESPLVLAEAGFLAVDLLAILLEYWLG